MLQYTHLHVAVSQSTHLWWPGGTQQHMSGSISADNYIVHTAGNIIRINNTSGSISADNYTVHTAEIICNNWHTREGSV